MTIPDPHRVLVDDLHAEIRRLRADLDRVEAELGEARRHLNPPIGDDPAPRPEDPRSFLRPLSASLRHATPRGEVMTPDPASPGGLEPVVPTLPDVGPVTIVPGITVSPSIIRQRTQLARDTEDGDLDDEI